MKSIIFIGHASRTKEGNQQLLKFIEHTLEQVDAPIKGYGFLEKSKPTIEEALESSIAAGAKEITVVPVLLLPGIHANQDIPNEIIKTKLKYPEVVFRYGCPIGSDELLIEIIQERLLSKGFTGKENVILVGHGSRSIDAANAATIVAKNLETTISASVEIAYLQTAPYFTEKLKNSIGKTYIVPHLLFSGDLFNNLQDTILGENILCDPIGFDPKLQTILLKRVQEAVVI